MLNRFVVAKGGKQCGCIWLLISCLLVTTQLGGEGGWILLVFPGVDSTSTGPQASWVQAVNGAYARGLNVVVRLSPPWGSSQYAMAAPLMPCPAPLIGCYCCCWIVLMQLPLRV